MNQKNTMQPPIAEQRPASQTWHGHTRTDDYAWLRNKEDPATIAYLDAENAFTEHSTQHTEGFQQTLYEEMLGHIQEDDASVPVKHGDYYYYHRIDEGKQYWAHFRKYQSLDADEELLLDENQLAEDGGHEYFQLGALEVSPNHHWLAYSTDTSGAETYSIVIKNLRTGELLPETLENNAGDVSWGDSNTLFYTTEEEETKRSDKLYRHKLNTPQSDDLMIFHEEDALFGVHAHLSKDERYLFIVSGSIETTEYHYIPTDSIDSTMQPVQPRINGLRYHPEHYRGRFYIVTNADEATNQKLVSCPVETPDKNHWEVVIEHRPDVQLKGIELFDEYMACQEREAGMNTLQIIQLDTWKKHRIEMPESLHLIGLHANPEFNTSTLRFYYTSMVTPFSTYDYDMNTREMELLKQTEVPGYEPELYDSQRIFATASDGTEIPVSLVYRKDVFGKQPAHCHLYGYGSYGATMEPTFSSSRLSLLDRGMIYAVAHVRGEQIYGRQWYEDGKFLKKKNTFTDFISCAEHLIDTGLTTPDRLSMEGGSAGGLLMGAVLNMAPQLFRAVIAGVPFVDVVNTMLDESIPLTTGEFEEWGNPKDEEYYHYMLSYSPYDNVAEQDYPALLVTAGLNDPRVQFWESAKWVAKLRAHKTDNNRLLLKMQMGAGHFSSSGRYAYLKDQAFEYAFLLDELGLAEE